MEYNDELMELENMVGSESASRIVSNTFNKRHLNQTAVGIALRMINKDATFTDQELQNASFSKFTAYPFTLGVTSGDPLPHGVVIWTRLAPEPLNDGGMPQENVAVQWEVAADPHFCHMLQSGETLAKPEFAHAVHVEVDGLEPNCYYYYRFHVGYEVSPIGRTKTIPHACEEIDQLDFAFVSCQHFEEGYYTAYRRIVEEDLDFVIHLGDTIYEYGADDSPDRVRFHKGEETLTLQDYRNRHAQYQTDRDYQAARMKFPWIVSSDDHDVENNYAGDIPENDVSRARFLLRRAAAYQAFYEHMPLRRPSVPEAEDICLYRRMTYGQLAEFNVLDTRQYRDDQANNDGNKPPSPESKDPSRTMLGDKQKQWLMDGLSRSQVTWNVIAQQVWFSQMDHQPGEGQLLNMDGWDGYAAERDQIADFLHQQEIANPIVLTGDVHTNWVFDIKTDFNDENSLTVGTEFVGTSISSGGDRADTIDDPEALLRENAHLKFFNDQRGYVQCTVTPNIWEANYKVLPYVSRPGASIETIASFTVEAGKPGVKIKTPDAAIKSKALT